MLIDVIVLFLAGAFLCNSLPHFISGVMGKPFPTPFATPRGIGNSSPVVNVLWGFLNLAVGVLLLVRQPITVHYYPNLIALLLGVLVMGLLSAAHFGKVQAGNLPK